jgi:hypothetical protein
MASAFFDKWLGRGSGVWTFFAPIAPGTLGGAVTGFLSTGVAWVNQFGAFGWWCAALIGFGITTGLYLAAGVAKNQFSQAEAKRKWAKDVDTINPLETHFIRKRINLAELANPITGRIIGKQFNDCELLGPANIFLLGQGVFNQVGFVNCDVVIVKNHVHIQNTLVIENCSFTGGTIARCTIFMPQPAYEVSKNQIPGFAAITYEAQDAGS